MIILRRKLFTIDDPFSKREERKKYKIQGSDSLSRGWERNLLKECIDKINDTGTNSSLESVVNWALLEYSRRFKSNNSRGRDNSGILVSKLIEKFR